MEFYKKIIWHQEFMSNWKIYIHGRPKGQDVWPSTDGNVNESLYLSSFLDSNIGNDVNSVMSIDTFDNNSYYTYIHRHNIDEYNHKRQKSYFAITICLRGLYSRDVHKMFELLDLVYTKKCLNLLLKKEEHSEVYLVDRFDYVEKELKGITDIIEKNINKVLFSTFTPLPPDINTKSSDILNYAISDVNSPAFISATQNYTVVVSPYFDSKEDEICQLRNEKEVIEQKLTNAISLRSDDSLEIKRLKDELVQLKKAKNGNTNITPTPSENGEIISLREENKQLKDEIAKLKNVLNTSEVSTAKNRSENVTYYMDIAIDKLKNISISKWLTVINSVLLIMCLWSIRHNHSTTGNEKESIVTEHSGNQASVDNIGQSPYNVKDALNYLFVKELFREAQMAKNQNIEIVGGTQYSIGKKYKIGLADSTIVEGLNPALSEWETSNDVVKISNDTLTIVRKGNAILYLKYNGIKVLKRSITSK